VSRKDMLEYIENSGGKDYPFFSEGKALRVATVEDMQKQSRLEQEKNEMRMTARRFVSEMHLPMKIVEAEPLLGGERITFYFLSEERPELRDLVGRLGKEYLCRIEMHSVGARDEARIVADYERCGQYCCCKNFLKVLKPVSMKSAKVQKATLDPLKISGRCGRLMCCLRYEDQTYEDLSKRLPRKNTRVGTPEGDGTVIDGQILTQLALVRLDVSKPDGSYNDVAVPVENLTPAVSPKPVPQTPAAPRQSGPPSRSGPGSGPAGPGGPGGGPPRGPRPEGRPDGRSPRPDRRDERPRDDRPREDRPRDDRPRDGQGPRGDRPRDGGPRDAGPQGQRPPRPQH
jgi:cell fate regulator YaaT (PSP1 superfamily)